VAGGYGVEIVGLGKGGVGGAGVERGDVERAQLHLKVAQGDAEASFGISEVASQGQGK
jgi:hypothetical protein